MAEAKRVFTRAGAVLLALGVQACSTATPSDAQLSGAVRGAISRNHAFAGDVIQVTADRGEVQLHGLVDSDSERRNAEEIARSVPGVKHVTNDLGMNI